MSQQSPHDSRPELPVDSDLLRADVPRPSRPAHTRASLIALVALGGMVGTAAREALSVAIPMLGVLPAAIFAINVIGAFGLGVLLENLARRGSDVGGRRALRLLIGTGFFGGFTTYSTLAVGTASLLRAQNGSVDPAAGVGYALATLLIGALGSIAGIAVGAALSSRAARRGMRPVDSDTRGSGRS